MNPRASSQQRQPQAQVQPQFFPRWELGTLPSRSAIYSRVLEACRQRGWNTSMARPRRDRPRDEWGWYQVSRRLGVSRTRVASLLCGAVPPRHRHVVRLARVFGWDPRTVAQELLDARRQWLALELQQAEDLTREDRLRHAWSQEHLIKASDETRQRAWPDKIPQQTEGPERKENDGHAGHQERVEQSE